MAILSAVHDTVHIFNTGWRENVLQKQPGLDFKRGG